MTVKQYLGLVGFGFVAVWIATNLGDAILCLIGAALFYALGGVIQGDIDLGELQERVRGSRSGGAEAGYRASSRGR